MYSHSSNPSRGCIPRPFPRRTKCSSHSLSGAADFIVSHGIIKGKGLQFPGTNFVDKTLKPHESTYKTTFLILSRIWYTICTRAWSPFPSIIPWKTMRLHTRRVFFFPPVVTEGLSRCIPLRTGSTTPGGALDGRPPTLPTAPTVAQLVTETPR